MCAAALNFHKYCIMVLRVRREKSDAGKSTIKWSLSKTNAKLKYT